LRGSRKKYTGEKTPRFGQNRSSSKVPDFDCMHSGTKLFSMPAPYVKFSALNIFCVFYNGDKKHKIFVT
jgi:hypothetical protein